MSDEEKKESGFKVVDKREDPESQMQKEEADKKTKEAAAKFKAEQEELMRQRESLLKCPNCKWRKKAVRFLQINHKALPPFIACPKCGSVFLHVDYIKNVLRMLVQKEKAEQEVEKEKKKIVTE